MSTKGDFFRIAKPHADEYPVVEGTRCVQVQIPDDTSYLPVLAGMVAALGNTWSSLGGREARQAWANMWQEAYAATDWSGCMNCEELIACLTPVLEAQTEAIINLLTNIQQFGTGTPGQPMTEEERTGNLATNTNDECNHDILWAQCLALVQFTNRAAEDIFERIEAATNVVELAGLSGEIPVIGLVLQQFGEELATETLNYYQEALQEGYLAEYTEDKEIELACQLFCLCYDDCVITIDRVYNQFYSNITDEVPDNPIEWIEMLVLLGGIDVTTDTVVDLVFWALWGMAKLGSIMFQNVEVVTLNTLLRLAVDDASPDWILLCTCGADWSYEYDSTTLPAWVTFPPEEWGEIGGNVFTQTTAVLLSQDVTGIYFETVFPTVQHLTGLHIHALETVGVEGAGVVNRFFALLDPSDNIIGGGDLPIVNGEWDLFQTFDVPNVKKVIVQYLFLGTTQEMTWQPVTLFGFGTNPFI